MTAPRIRLLTTAVLCATLTAGCSTAYERKPVSFLSPTSMPSQAKMGDSILGARAFDDPAAAQETFGFDIHGAGLFPVQVVIDNKGKTPLAMRSEQTFLEDRNGQMWPVLDADTANERATKYASTHDMVKEGAYKGMLGAAAGAIVGTAVGVLAGNKIAKSAAKGAAVGAAAGAILGGVQSGMDDKANEKVTNDLNLKMLNGKAIEPGGISYGLIYFPAEAKGAAKLRLQLTEEGGKHAETLEFAF